MCHPEAALGSLQRSCNRQLRAPAVTRTRWSQAVPNLVLPSCIFKFAARSLVSDTPSSSSVWRVWCVRASVQACA